MKIEMVKLINFKWGRFSNKCLARERHLPVNLKTFIRINQERKLKDKLGEQIRTLQQRNEELRTELVEREEWKKTDLEHAKKNDDFAKLELEKMRKTLDEVKNENHKLSQSVIGEQVSKEKIEKHLRGWFWIYVISRLNSEKL